MATKTRLRPQRGSALIAVLWLSAALSAIAFSVATTVRGETERTSTAAEGLRAYYLASGAVDRALLWIYWGVQFPGKYYHQPMPWLTFTFPTGIVDVEIGPETAKMSVNTARPGDLARLLMAAGAEPDRAAAIVQGILAWRSQGPEGSPFPGLGGAGRGNSPGGPTFTPPHASFEEIEELLLVPGMTPDLFYGSFDTDPQGRPIARGGLKDCLSVYGANDRFDVNAASPILLSAIGLDPAAVGAIVAARRAVPFRSLNQLAAFGIGGPALQRLAIGGNTIWTIRATAHPVLANGARSDLSRTVSATVKYLPSTYNPPYQVMRWYDDSSTVSFMPDPATPEPQALP